jgi:hypothetical protein
MIGRVFFTLPPLHPLPSREGMRKGALEEGESSELSQLPPVQSVSLPLEGGGAGWG